MGFGLYCPRLDHDTRRGLLLFRSSKTEECTLYDISQHGYNRGRLLPSVFLAYLFPLLSGNGNTLVVFLGLFLDIQQYRK
jgi:hypothetical protein